MSGTKHTGNSIGRTVLICLAALLQIAWLVYELMRLRQHYAVIGVITGVLSLLVVFKIYGTRQNSAFKIFWFFIIALFPVMGLLFYVLAGYSIGLGYMKKRFYASCRRRLAAMPENKETAYALRRKNMRIARQSEYISQWGTYPVYGESSVTYFPTAGEGLEAQKTALKGAEKFIFMEYFAIEDSRAFSEIKQILAEKARQGVEVHLLYDDAGSLGYVNKNFTRQMQELGIQCKVFNPLMPVLNIFMNHRDHRKLTVVDGRIGFTGGYNLADEYFNYISPYGYWKDTGVMLEGGAVQNLTAMFLEMWDAMSGDASDYSQYLLPAEHRPWEQGYVQPYGDSPLDEERVGEIVYLNMIKNAVDYVHITTPYLILDDETISELTLAAKRGVDVRILTPGIPDKKLIYQLTRSYYGPLVDCGVRIYEYTPGFNHAKMLVCDGESAVVGTINLDYRSLYLHFEDGVFMYDCKAVGEIEKDLMDCYGVSEDVTEKYANRSPSLRIWQSILRLMSPLM